MNMKKIIIRIVVTLVLLAVIAFLALHAVVLWIQDEQNKWQTIEEVELPESDGASSE